MLATLKKSHGAGLLALCAGTFLMSALLTLLYALNRLASGPTDDASMTQGLSWTVSLWIILALLASTALLRRRFFDPAVQSDAALATRLIRRNMLRVDAPAPAGPKPRQQRASPGPTLAAAGALGAGVALAAGFSKQVSEQLPPLNDSPDPDPDIQPATPMDHDLTATASSVPHSHPERPDLVDPPIHHSGFHSVDTATTWSQDDVIDMPDLDESIAKAADLPDLHGSWVAAPIGPDIPDMGDLDDAIASAVGLSDVSELAEISDIATETVGDALKDALS